MDFNHMAMMLPGIEPEELMLLQNLAKDMNESQQKQFLTFYQNKRKEQQTLTILTIIGFFGVAGLQRFVTNQVGMGILYLFTIGFCGIGTIIDLVNIRSMATDYNQKQAIETAGMVKWMQQQQP